MKILKKFSLTMLFKNQNKKGIIKSIVMKI